MLVVDDEPLLLGVMSRILHDCEVETFTDARLALDVIAAGRAFDVILADISMPGMSGVSFYQELQSASPPLAARVIFMSGGVFEPDLDVFLTGIPNLRIGKPFRGPTLRAAVQQVLDHRDEATPRQS